jgi:hypothetical protein
VKIWTAAILILLLAGSCVSVGPMTIPRDREEYVQALRESWKRQLLLNIVAMRYGEAPAFLEVASVINQYVLAGQANAALGWSSGTVSGSTQGLGVNGSFADRPTITYTPVTGDRFVRQMLTPMPPASLIALVQAGWPVDFLFRLTVRSMNGLNNVTGNRMMGSAGSADFFRVLESLRRIQLSGSVGLRVVKGEKGDATVLVLTGRGSEEVEEDIRTVRDKLGLGAGAGEVRVTYGTVPRDDRELAMLTRSATEMLVEMASWVEVPEPDLADGRAAPAREQVNIEGFDVGPLVKVHSAESEPEGMFAAVAFHDHWFFIDDRDLPSKRVFSFMMLLLSLTESGTGQGTPLVTVSTGN